MVGVPRRAVLVAVLAAIPLSLAVAATAEPVAVIAAVKGKVEVTPSGAREALRATFGRPLEPGDKVAVGPAGSATLFFNDGNVIELGEKSALTVSGRVVRAGSAKAGLSGEVYASVSRFVTAGNRKTGLVAASEMRGAGDPSLALILSPRQSDVLGDAPAIAWRPVKGATRYRVSVTSAESGELFSAEVDESPGPDGERRLAWPSDAPRLAPGGDYLLQVEALDDVKPLRTESTAFRAATRGTVESVRANLDRIASTAGGLDSPAARWLAGSYLSGLNLNGEALEQFTALARLSPGSSAAHEALGNIYAKVGLMDLAAAEYQQALSLAREAD